MVDISGATVGARLGPLALVVGITGHRDLRDEDREALEAQVRAVFVELRGRYRETPLMFLSPLAEGADRLAARVALACGARLIVPLPLPRTLYESDFHTPASLREFNELLQRSDGWFELPMLPGNTDERVRADGEHRDRQYAYVGAFIARHTQVLVALWDGVASDAEGGTAQVVRFKLKGVPERYALAEEQSSLLDSEHAKQYGRMSITFANAKRHLEEHMKAGRSGDAVALIEELGKEALVENGDWVLLHRERPLPVPKA